MSAQWTWKRGEKKKKKKNQTVSYILDMNID
jgi:hypothetical protein